jgi:hypothetical protein
MSVFKHAATQNEIINCDRDCDLPVCDVSHELVKFLFWLGVINFDCVLVKELFLLFSHGLKLEVVSETLFGLEIGFTIETFGFDIALVFKLGFDDEGIAGNGLVLVEP